MVGELETQPEVYHRAPSAPMHNGVIKPLAVPLHQAAALIGLTPSEFKAAVTAGEMPHPIRLGGQWVWSVAGLKRAFDALPTVTESAATRQPFADDCGSDFGALIAELEALQAVVTQLRAELQRGQPQ